MAEVFKITQKNGKKSRCYYGKVQEAPGRWRKKRLFTDKEASKRKLHDLQKQEDQRTAGMITPDMERLERPIAELAKEYHEHLRTCRRSEDHVKISECLMGKLIERGNWQRFRDVTQASVEQIVRDLQTEGKTPSYANKFITRVKAFVRWLLPEGHYNPLAKLKRLSEKGAERRRARRAATAEEANAFFRLWPTLPESRHLSYALAMLNGLRRNEIAGLRWGQLALNATIPFIRVKQKQGEGEDCIPLHPYVAKLLRERMEALPLASVVSAVPDPKTLKKDLATAGVTFTDAEGKRLDFHGLRHTFQTSLDRSHCSRATRMRLMRHATKSITDGYAHAELADMLEALKRLPSPDCPSVSSVPALKTGTTDGPIDAVADTPKQADHQTDQTAEIQRAFSEFMSKNLANSAMLPCPQGWTFGAKKKPDFSDDSGAIALAILNTPQGAGTVTHPWPDTQVD